MFTYVGDSAWVKLSLKSWTSVCVDWLSTETVLGRFSTPLCDQVWSLTYSEYRKWHRSQGGGEPTPTYLTEESPKSGKQWRGNNQPQSKNQDPLQEWIKNKLLIAFRARPVVVLICIVINSIYLGWCACICGWRFYLGPVVKEDLNLCLRWLAVDWDHLKMIFDSTLWPGLVTDNILLKSVTAQKWPKSQGQRGMLALASVSR